jgi:hypothetical protein
MDTESNRVLWRDTLGAKAGDLIGLREQITAHLRQGFFPLFAASTVKETSSAPRNPEAYDLFLCASAVSRDPQPNKQALAMLKRAVALDPAYAPASQWASVVEADLRLRQGKLAEASALLRKLSDVQEVRLMEPCLEGRPLREEDPIQRRSEAELLAERDPEPKYFFAARAAYCGNTGLALRLLRLSIQGNFLASPAMDRDPLLEKIRNTPEFAAIRALAVEKQKPFAARRGGH